MAALTVETTAAQIVLGVFSFAAAAQALYADLGFGSAGSVVLGDRRRLDLLVGFPSFRTRPPRSIR